MSPISAALQAPLERAISAALAASQADKVGVRVRVCDYMIRLVCAYVSVIIYIHKDVYICMYACV